MNLNSRKSEKVDLKHLSTPAEFEIILKSWKTTLMEDNLIEKLLLINVNQLTFVAVVGLIQ